MLKIQFSKAILIATLCLPLLCIISCHPIFCMWKVGFERVDDIQMHELVGRYQLTDYSKKVMKYEGNYSKILKSTIDLKADGTYEILNAPDWLFNDFGEANGEYINKSGKWSLSCDKEYCITELSGLATGELVFKKSNKLHILLTIGDPDRCIGLTYIKKQ